MIEWDGHTYSAAIEVELTQKNTDRLRDKIEHYVARSGYQLVLYICGNPAIYRAVERAVRYNERNSPSVKFAKNPAQIYLVDLVDLQEDFGKAIFKAEGDSFSFNDFSEEIEKLTDPKNITE